MDGDRWEIQQGWAEEYDGPIGVVLYCLSCAYAENVEGDSLTRIIDLAADHDRAVHRR